MNGYVLGLAGDSRAGKDTVGRLIQELRPDWIVRCVAFADDLKVSAAAALGYAGTRAEQIARMDHLKEHGCVVCDPGDESGGQRISGRAYLQLYGTEAHRDVFGPSFWGERLLPRPDAPFAGRDDAFDLLVITDVRFAAEVQRVRACGGALWGVQRAGVEQHRTGHSSEAPVEVDYIIDNAGTLDDLRRSVAVALAAQDFPC